MSGLTTENYTKGMLIDAEWLGGVCEEVPENASTPKFKAFIIDHNQGITVGQTHFDTAEEAVAALALIPRPWVFENTGGCKTGKCGQDGCGTRCKACHQP